MINYLKKIFAKDKEDNVIDEIKQSIIETQNIRNRLKIYGYIDHEYFYHTMKNICNDISPESVRKTWCFILNKDITTAMAGANYDKALSLMKTKDNFIKERTCYTLLDELIEREISVENYERAHDLKMLKKRYTSLEPFKD